jgi:hypothetical protein
MIVKVSHSESELIEKTCAIFGLDFRKFTIENNPLLVQIEVLNEGNEIPPSTAWNLCSVIRTEQQIKNV